MCIYSCVSPGVLVLLTVQRALINVDHILDEGLTSVYFVLLEETLGDGHALLTMQRVGKVSVSTVVFSQKKP